MSYYTNMALNEGRQKDIYLATKAINKKYDDEEDYDRYRNRLHAGDGYKTGGNPHEDKEKDASKASENLVKKWHVRDKVSKEFEKRTGSIRNKRTPVLGEFDSKDHAYTTDAILRHNRRHPDRYIESGIFSECNFIEFAY